MIDGAWNIEPAAWNVADGVLRATSLPHTDFWRTTHYGFIRDSGHVFGTPVAGDFTAVARFTGEYRVLYDQAGLMLRGDAEHWIKAGIEFVDGSAWLSVVVTDDRSDWSLSSQVDPAAPRWLQLSRTGDDISVQHSDDGERWTLMRVTSLAAGPADVVGPMLACPEAEGFSARFDVFDVQPGSGPE
jgi:regulation of enolase protein 1 (concanavalin A-like superfamily)